MIFGEGAPSPSYWHPGDCCNRMQLSVLDDVNLLRISYDLLCSVAFIWYQLVSCAWHHLYGIICILSILIVYNLNDLLLPSALNPELFTGTFNEDTSIYILHKFESILWKPLLGADYPSSEHKHFIISFWKISKVDGIGTVPHVQRLYFTPGFPRPIKPIKLITFSTKGGWSAALGLMRWIPWDLIVWTTYGIAIPRPACQICFTSRWVWKTVGWKVSVKPRATNGCGLMVLLGGSGYWRAADY